MNPFTKGSGPAQQHWRIQGCTSLGKNKKDEAGKWLPSKSGGRGRGRRLAGASGDGSRAEGQRRGAEQVRSHGPGVRHPGAGFLTQGAVHYVLYTFPRVTFHNIKRKEAKNYWGKKTSPGTGGARGLAGGWLGRQTVELGAQPAPPQCERYAEAGTARSRLWRTRNGPTPTVKAVAPSECPAKRAEPAWPVCTCRRRESLPCLHKPIPPERSVPPSFIFPASFEVFVLILRAFATLLQRCCG